MAVAVTASLFAPAVVAVAAVMGVVVAVEAAADAPEMDVFACSAAVGAAEGRQVVPTLVVLPASLPAASADVAILVVDTEAGRLLQVDELERQVVFASARQAAGCRTVDSVCMHSSVEAWELEDVVGAEVVQGLSWSGERDPGADLLSKRVVTADDPVATVMDHAEIVA